jgi:eukaryotic-like serine/threonine-protein kinase
MPGEPGPPNVEADAPTEQAPLGQRPVDDDLALDVAQSRIAAKLFGEATEVAVGRYKLLELVGRGGMGVVWGAWDPELERKVAIKLVGHLRADARDRIVDEARALAKLSHPNVVPVYDVGVVDERVYLVMEWVPGETLRAHWGQPRSVREIVELFVQAARGLAAVHDAGLVHRDFKPENAMVGRDGRLRVLDFGLARADLDEDARGEIAGTPRYMPPEQLAGETPTPAVDQFALCVSLREALEARPGGDVPRWLAAIVTRGTAAKPNERFGSMHDIVHELGRDPARVWRRRIVAGIAVAATASAFAIGRAAKTDACSSSPAGAISAALQGRIGAHLDGLGPFAAGERPALLELLDKQQRAWQVAHREACVAHDRGELTTSLYERRLTCLARAESSLAVTAELLEHATVATFPDARVAAGAVIDPAQCERVDQSLVVPPPAPLVATVRAAETLIERARLLSTAARPEATEVAARARSAAEATSYMPVIARALLVEGRAQMFSEDDRARATLEQAMRRGFAVHDDAVAVEAFARMAWLAGYDGTVVDGTTIIEAVAARLGADDTFARLLLLNNLASVRAATSDGIAAARPYLETAFREWRPGRSENDYELVSIPQNLAFIVDQPVRSLDLLAQARAAAVKLVGESHPRVLEIDRMRVLFQDLDGARQANDAACGKLTRLFPELKGRRAECEYQSGWLADEAGDAAAVAAHFTAAPLDPNSKETPTRRRAQIAAAMIALARHGDAKQLATELERSASEDAKAPQPFTRAVAADAYIAAARAWHAHGDAVAELRCWNEARKLLEAVNRPAVARRLARVRTELARGTKDRVTAASFAKPALAWYRSVGGYAGVVGELTRIADAN